MCETGLDKKPIETDYGQMEGPAEKKGPDLKPFNFEEMKSDVDRNVFELVGNLGAKAEKLLEETEYTVTNFGNRFDVIYLKKMNKFIKNLKEFLEV